MRDSYIPTLDGWRAVAILLVLLDHASDSIDAALHRIGLALPHALQHRGQMGVYIFFALSGYLITSKLVQEHQATGRISLKNFYIRRTFRILPLMWAFLLVAAVLAWAGAFSVAGHQWVSAATFWANYNPYRGWYVGNFWSLAVEEHFYLLWPAALILLGVRRGLGTALVLAVTIAAWREIEMHWRPTGYTDVNIYSRTDLVMDTLLLGAAAAILMSRPQFRRGVERLASWTWALIALATITTTVLKGPGVKFVQSAMITLLIVGTVVHASAWPGRVLELRPLRWLGRLSYSIYMWQQIFLVWNEQRSPGMRPWQDVPWNFIAIFACAVPSYYLLEKPLMRLGHRLTKTPARRPQSRPAPLPRAA